MAAVNRVKIFLIFFLVGNMPLYVINYTHYCVLSSLRGRGILISKALSNIKNKKKIPEKETDFSVHQESKFILVGKSVVFKVKDVS